MKLMPIGYCLKRVRRRADVADADFPVGPPVEEIASVSGCISRRPEVDFPDSRLLTFASIAAAEAPIPAVERGLYTVFRYDLYPATFTETGDEPMAADISAVAATKDGFQSIGYDVVELADDASFGCSPLSCNGMASGVEVNRWCLVDELKDAIGLAERFAVEKPEPGPYVVVRVSCAP